MDRRVIVEVFQRVDRRVIVEVFQRVDLLVTPKALVKAAQEVIAEVFPRVDLQGTQEVSARAVRSLEAVAFPDPDQTANPQAEALKASPSKRQITAVVTESWMRLLANILARATQATLWVATTP